MKFQTTTLDLKLTTDHLLKFWPEEMAFVTLYRMNFLQSRVDIIAGLSAGGLYVQQVLFIREQMEKEAIAKADADATAKQVSDIETEWAATKAHYKSGGHLA